METYIAVLRGVNVSGHNKVKMQDLRNALGEIGLDELKTYIQSGNLVFRANEKNTGTIADKISEKIRTQFGYDVSVMVLTLKEWQKVAESNPFLSKKGTDLKRVYVVFLAENPAKDNLKKLNTYNYPPDEFIVKGKAIYMYCPVSYGNSRLSLGFFESKLKVKGTARNLNTVNKLIEMAEAIGQ